MGVERVRMACTCSFCQETNHYHSFLRHFYTNTVHMCLILQYCVSLRVLVGILQISNTYICLMIVVATQFLLFI